jgi:signal transduction histidine kinase
MTTVPSATGGVVVALRTLLIAAGLVPLVLLGAGGFLSYRLAMLRATADLTQRVSILQEQAVKVFDTHLLLGARVNDAIKGMDDDTIRSHEREIHDWLADAIKPLPQVRSVLIFSKNGHALVNSRIYPVNPTTTYRDSATEPLFADPTRQFYISGLRTGSATGQQFFGVLRRRERVPGEFDGFISITVSPDFFTSFYGKLANNDGDSTAALLRTDGVFLARSPAFDNAGLAASRATLLMAAIRTKPTGGVVDGRSPIDGLRRLAVYRLLPNYPVYVVAGRSFRSISAEWRGTLSPYIGVLFAAVVPLFALTLFAISRSRREREALAQAREEIHRREIAEEALRQAQKMDAVGRLTGGVAHDFNNLLTIVLGNLETLRRRLGDDAPELARLVDGATRGAMRGAALTQKLLAFSRRQPLEPVAIDVNQLVADMSELLERSLGPGVAVTTEFDPRAGLAFADLNQLESMLLNLAVNARDAMPTGGKLTIATANVMLGAQAVAHDTVAPGPYVLVTVSDTGAGMPPDVAERAFEPFFTTKAIGQGTGLGLSQVYGFVKQSGGHVAIDSTVGVGTSVRIYLPLLRPADVASARARGDRPRTKASIEGD